nr:hypothetical protein [Tanacetum cinerariifolium]
MATIIEQQVVLDEALVPSIQRLRIGRSNFRLPSDIQSKESTLQVIYDALRRCPFFKAFFVTADIHKGHHTSLHVKGFVNPKKKQELTNDEIRNTKAYKEYYACATREAAPKLKASARRKRSGSDTSITPPTAITTPTTTVAIAPRLTAAAKGKQQPKPKAHLTPQR